MEYLSVVFLHILFGIVWAGGAIITGFFILPAVLEAGPGGGAVMAGVAKRKLPIFLSIASVMVVLTGARLYMFRFSSGWLTSPEGFVLTLGALLAVAALAMGLGIQKPTVEKLGALSAKIAASGQPPSSAEKAELDALRTRLKKIGALTAWHLLGAATLMAMHRLAAAL